MTIAATTMTNAETVAVAARNNPPDVRMRPGRLRAAGVAGRRRGALHVVWGHRLGSGNGAVPVQQKRTRRPGRKSGQAVTIVWRPSPEVVERANVTRLMRAHGIATEEELIERLDLGRRVVLGRRDPRPRPRVLRALHLDPRHLPRGRVGDVVRRRVGEPRAQLRRPMGRTHPRRRRDRVGGRGGHHPASLVPRAAREASDRLANGLAALGVRSLDAVGIFLPPTPEAVVAR